MNKLYEIAMDTLKLVNKRMDIKIWNTKVAQA